MKNINIVCKDFDLSDAIKDYMEEKISSLYKFLSSSEDTISVHCRLGKASNRKHNGDLYVAEATITTPGKQYVAKSEDEDVYAAIDFLKDELFHTISHHKEKARTLDMKEAQNFKQEIHNVE